MQEGIQNTFNYKIIGYLMKILQKKQKKTENGSVPVIRSVPVLLKTEKNFRAPKRTSIYHFYTTKHLF